MEKIYKIRAVILIGLILLVFAWFALNTDKEPIVEPPIQIIKVEPKEEIEVPPVEEVKKEVKKVEPIKVKLVKVAVVPKYATTIKFIKTKAKENSGLEWFGGKWVSVDDNGKIYHGKTKHKHKGDLEGIAYCGGKFYIAKESTKDIDILNTSFDEIGELQFKIGSGNNGTEAISCFKSGLLVAGNEKKIYHITTKGAFLQSFAVPHKKITGLDYDGTWIYALSDKDDVVMILNKYGKLEREIKVGKKGQWEGLKVLSGVIHISEDRE